MAPHHRTSLPLGPSMGVGESVSPNSRGVNDLDRRDWGLGDLGTAVTAESRLGLQLATTVGVEAHGWSWRCTGRRQSFRWWWIRPCRIPRVSVSILVSDGGWYPWPSSQENHAQSDCDPQSACRTLGKLSCICVSMAFVTHCSTVSANIDALAVLVA